MLDSAVAFIDSNPRSESFLGKKVIRPENIRDYDFDAIVVSATRFNGEIETKCLEFGIPLDKICWANNCRFSPMNKNEALAERVFGKDAFEQISFGGRKILPVYNNIQKLSRTSPLRAVKEYAHWISEDFVRLAEFEFAVNEIRKRALKGNVAELGVFRGEFAQFINAAFPDKTLYLFDTFDSFDESEAKKEIDSGLITENFAAIFKETSVGLVLDKMTHKESVAVKKGFFPGSLCGLEDTFCFVSLDVDLEESIYNGLDYFYPRLESGGYLFVHDYANQALPQVERAVDRYERALGTALCKLPLCDNGGTLVIIK